MLTREQLAEWRRLAEAATAGPWWERKAFILSGVVDRVLDIQAVAPSDEISDADVAFITSARSAVPALIAEVERLANANEEARTLLHIATGCERDLAALLARCYPFLALHGCTSLAQQVRRVLVEYGVTTGEKVVELMTRAEFEKAVLEIWHLAYFRHDDVGVYVDCFKHDPDAPVVDVQHLDEQTRYRMALAAVRAAKERE